jgi:hypothetical protein
MTDADSLEGCGPPSAILAWSKSGADLASRRSQALADYWVAMANAGKPERAIAVQMDYWTHWVDDYAAAAAGALSPFVSSPGEA